jgi:hypothetical protein
VSEKILSRNVVGQLKRNGLDPQRIEDAIRCGVPDVNYRDGWIELKVSPGWPKRPGTRLALDHFTPAQRVWLSRRCRHGGRAFVLLRVGAREYMLFRGDVAAKYLGYTPREFLVQRALGHWPDGLIEEEFIRCLTESVPPTSPPASDA